MLALFVLVLAGACAPAPARLEGGVAERVAARASAVPLASASASAQPMEPTTMPAVKWDIAFHWGVRPEETLDVAVARVFQFMQLLPVPAGTPWVVRTSWDDATELGTIVSDVATLRNAAATPLLAAELERTDGRTVTSFSHRAALHPHWERGDSRRLRFNVGTSRPLYPAWIGNWVMVELNSELLPREYAQQHLVALATSAARLFRPYWGCINGGGDGRYGAQLHDMSRGGDYSVPGIGWITYIDRAEYGVVPRLDPLAHVYDVDGVGYLIVIAKEPWNMFDPAVAAAVQAVDEKLEEAGILVPPAELRHAPRSSYWYLGDPLLDKDAGPP